MTPDDAIDLPSTEQSLLHGTEPFHGGRLQDDLSVLDFWRWSASNLLDNTTRGMLAEFLVAYALGCTGKQRVEWDVVDLTTADGTRVEVKSAAYLQSWHQKRLSTVSYGIARTTAWDPATNEWGTEPQRHADVYVFCLLDHKDKVTVDPLNFDQWTFFAVGRHVLDERLGDQKTMALSTLRKLNPEETDLYGLKQAVGRAAALPSTAPTG